MSFIVNSFLSLPYVIRVAILLAVLILIIWRFSGRYILCILSCIPFLLKKGFCAVYLLVEIPVAALHEKFGSVFGKIDNQMSRIGENVVRILDCWYKAWKTKGKMDLKKSLLAYVLCIVFVLAPSFINVNNKLKIGETLYLHGEAVCVNWLEERGWYNSEVQTARNQEGQAKNEILENESLEITLVVSGVSSSLLVRDIPSTEDCIILGRLQNDDVVVWSGQMVFSEVDNGHVEPWVKIVTVDGVEGWSRLYYLHPEQYVDMEFQVIDGELSIMYEGRLDYYKNRSLSEIMEDNYDGEWK